MMGRRPFSGAARGAPAHPGPQCCGRGLQTAHHGQEPGGQASHQDIDDGETPLKRCGGPPAEHTTAAIQTSLEVQDAVRVLTLFPLDAETLASRPAVSTSLVVIAPV